MKKEHRKTMVLIIAVIIVFLLIVCFIGGIIVINGILDDEDYPSEVPITEIYIDVSVYLSTLDGNFNSTYVLVPTLVDNNFNPIGISNLDYDSSSEYNYSVTQLNTQNGWCLNITPVPDLLRIYFNYTFPYATFNTNSEYDIENRFYENTPGISIWNDESDSVISQFYCNEGTRSFHFSYYRDNSFIHRLSDIIDEDNDMSRPPGWNEFKLSRDVISISE